MPVINRILDYAGLVGAVCIVIGVFGLLALPTLHISAEYSIIRFVGYEGPMDYVRIVTVAGWVFGIILLKLEERFETDGD